MWEELKKPILALAPMAGFTDSSFRQICKDFGADVVYSEMASVSALYYHPQKTLGMLAFKPKERPYLVQLFGANPSHFKEAVKIVAKDINPDGIDINFGCPVRKVIKIGAGAVLMQDFKLSRKIIETVLENTGLPVSVKTRSQVQDVTVVDFLKNLKGLNIRAIMIHGRRFSQGFNGAINVEIIKQVKNMFGGIVLANGGMTTPEKIKEVIEVCGADGVGLARGVLGHPWLFAQTKEYQDKGRYSNPNFGEIKRVILRHAKICYEHKQTMGIRQLRKHLCWYITGFPKAKTLREKLIRVETLTELEEILNKFLPVDDFFNGLI